MLPHLTAYLLQFKSVVIPHVGTLCLEQQSSFFDVADKCMLPPSYAIKIDAKEDMPDHQLHFLQKSIGKEKNAVVDDLSALGEAIKADMTDGGFYWKGIGTIANASQDISFNVPALQVLSVEKIIRQNVTHNILVGDREISSSQIAEEKVETVSYQRDWGIIVGWVVLVLAILAIVVLLYLGKFKTDAAGSKLSPNEWELPF